MRHRILGGQNFPLALWKYHSSASGLYFSWWEVVCCLVDICCTLCFLISPVAFSISLYRWHVKLLYQVSPRGLPVIQAAWCLQYFRSEGLWISSVLKISLLFYLQGRFTSIFSIPFFGRGKSAIYPWDLLLTCFNLFAKFARSWRNDSIRFTILSSTASRLEFNFLFLNFTVSTILLIS